LNWGRGWFWRKGVNFVPPPLNSPQKTTPNWKS
jgi:hypothetical protein